MTDKTFFEESYGKVDCLSVAKNLYDNKEVGYIAIGVKSNSEEVNHKIKSLHYQISGDNATYSIEKQNVHNNV